MLKKLQQQIDASINGFLCMFNVIAQLKITDTELFDVDAFKRIAIQVDA